MQVKSDTWKKDEPNYMNIGYSNTLRSRQAVIRIMSFYNEEGTDHVKVIDRVDNLTSRLDEFLAGESAFGEVATLRADNKRLDGLACTPAQRWGLVGVGILVGTISTLLACGKLIWIVGQLKF